MQLNNIQMEQGMNEYDTSEQEENVALVDGGASAEPNLLAMMQEMQKNQQQLSAMFRDGTQRKNTKGVKVPDVTAEDLKVCRERNLCLKCKKAGHFARDCKYQGPTVRLN